MCTYVYNKKYFTSLLPQTIKNLSKAWFYQIMFWTQSTTQINEQIFYLIVQ